VTRTLNIPTVIELFAGVGGFRLGLERAGWQVIWSNQWEPTTKAQHASSCYIANFGDGNHSSTDIHLAVVDHLKKKRTIPNSDLIVGGFPCQDYSVAKSLRTSVGLEGKKGILWWQIHKLVESQKPKFVFLENVDRLLKSPSGQRGRDFAVMLRTLGDLGYQIEWRVVNAAEYGFPQRRIRVFIVATRLDLVDGSIEPLRTITKNGILAKSLPVVSSDDLLEDELNPDAADISQNFNKRGLNSPFKNAGVYRGGRYWTIRVEPRSRKRPKMLGDILLPNEDVPKEFWIDASSLEKWRQLKGAKRIERVSKSGHSYVYAEGSMAFPDSLVRPSRTILTAEGGATPSRFKHIVKIGRRYRRLTPIELERLNGFPDNWTKFDENGQTISDARRAFFMGNALVVGLVERVGLEIKNQLTELL